MLSVDSKLGHI